MLFSGMSSFGAKRVVQDEKVLIRKDNANATNELAKIRFNINLERTKRAEMEKEIEE